MDVRVLLLSYYFPPAGGPGVQRVLKCVKYLPEFGVHPIVVTVDPAKASYPARDSELLAEVPNDIEIVKTSTLEPFGAYARLTGRTQEQSVKVGSLGQSVSLRERLAHFMRANVILPDARVGWVPFAYRSAKRILDREREVGSPISVVMSSGPPHSTHLAARALKARARCKWLADYRDPWTDIGYYEELPMLPLARAWDRWMERRTLQAADLITTVSPHWKALLSERARGGADIRVVQNGFDAGDFADPPPPSDGEGLFTFTHVGSLYDSRNPIALWRALGQLRHEGALKRLRLRIVGNVGDVVANSIKDQGLESITEFVDYADHSEAVRLMRTADLLLLVIEQFGADAGMITGKLYEYLASGRPVIGIGPVDGDAHKLLLQTGAGDLFAHDDGEGIKQFVLEHFGRWCDRRRTVGASPESVTMLTRRHQTEILAGYIRELAAAP